MSQLRFTTVVEAPLTVAFDVARALGRPWPHPLREVESVRPHRDVYQGASGALTHTRLFSPTATGTLVVEEVDWAPGRWALDGRPVLRRRLLRSMQAHRDAYAAAAALRALSVPQVVGAALVDQRRRVLVARRGTGPLAGLWEFPGGKVERGEDHLTALVRECQEELGVLVAPQAFLGEVPLDGVVSGGAPGASTLRVWWGRVAVGEVVAHEHSELRWVAGHDLEALDWIPADRPLLPAVRALLSRLS